MKWVVEDIFGRDYDRAIEIDKEVIKLHFTKGTKDSYDTIIEQFKDEERIYALIRWAFLAGIKRALNHTEEYRNLIYLLNALVKLRAEEALEKFLKAEFEDDYSLLEELEEVRV